MRVMLAPMEGVVDHLMRDMLTRVGGFDQCVTEFVRVVDQKLPKKTFYRLCPELHNGGKTPAGVPVRVQLLGQHPQWLAENAQTAIELGSPGVDLNFGCPAPKVTKICAGAALMGEPENLVSMCEAVVDRVNIPVTAKMRLGTGQGNFNAKEICQELENVGIQRLCVHGRTLRQRYSGVADWDYIKEVVKSLEVPVIANGDVVDSKSAAACLQKTNASGLMIGRGAIGRPAMFGYLKVGLGWIEETDLPWVKINENWSDLDETQQAFATRKWCWDRYIQLSKDTVGIQPRWMQRHAVAFSKGLPGGKKIRSIMHEMPTPEDFADAISEFLIGVPA